jgi:hypothetical protein
MKYLRGIRTVEEMEDIIEQMKKFEPMVLFKIQNYHFDTKSRHTNV